MVYHIGNKISSLRAFSTHLAGKELSMVQHPPKVTDIGALAVSLYVYIQVIHQTGHEKRQIGVEPLLNQRLQHC